jgi:hypothetical protein
VNKIDNVENVICSAETMRRHPELYHYTKPAAFEGIIGSQTIWCSHYREMADANEVVLMRELMPPALAPYMDAAVASLNRQNRRHWERAGGGARTARRLVTALYGATFDGKAIYSALEAYSVSFSTHSDDTEFDREHGVPNQWEEYGKEGYCLVFDIGDVASLLKQEGEARYWAWLMLEPVRYADRPVHELFPELIEGLTDTLRQFLGGVPVPTMAVPEFLLGTTLLKAAKYKPEREVRIVAIPGTAELAKYATKEFPDQFDPTQPLPVIDTRPDNGKRYVALFRGLPIRLPIKRVIVGPGGQQEERAERARVMIPDIPITISCCERV